MLQCKAKTLYYNRIEGFLFKIIFSTVTVELTVDFFFARKSSRSLIRKSLRGKFRKNRNIDLENSSLLQCKAKTLYYNHLEGFSLEIIFSTVTVELTVDFSYLS